MRSMKPLLLAFALLGVVACKQTDANTAGSTPDGKNTATRDTTGAVTPGKDASARQVEADAKPFNRAQPYAFPTGVIELTYSGDLVGRETIYFKDYGRTSRVDDQYVGKDNSKHNQTVITTPDKIYFVDNTTHRGYVDKLTEKTLAKMSNLLPDITAYGVDSAMRKNGYALTGRRKVAEQDCEVYGGKNAEFCFANGVNIQTTMDLGGMKYTLKATKIDQNATVSDDKFAPPANARLTSFEVYQKAVTKDQL